MLIGWKIIVKKYKLVPDTSILIDNHISKNISDFNISELIIHNASIAELENQANQNKDTGFLGLDEIKNLQEISKKNNFIIKFSGNSPNQENIRNAKQGSIDSLIRDLAHHESAKLITSDFVQSEVGKTLGIETIYIEKKSKIKLSFEKYFSEDFMSLHIKEDEFIKAKKGWPGKWEFIKVNNKKLNDKEIKLISDEIIESARYLKNSFIETNKRGSVIAQIKNFRIVITKPPLSDAWEITIVRPVKKLNLSDYRLSSKVLDRLDSRAEGILISGSPGSGKSTFAQSLANKYSQNNKVVKSLESPRDMQLPPEITQYSLNKGSHDELRDILLLTRPDYTLYDEVRNLKDFELFSDMRLAGVGMVGVVHASNPIDSIQRFIGKIEVGMIPSIIDTVIFIKNGSVEKIYGIRMGVKVPTGMREKDLARPVVDVFDFDTDNLEYEIYSYGDSTVVMPIEIIKNKKLNEKRQMRWRLIETSKYFEFLFFTPVKSVEVIINNILVTKLPLNKGKSLKVSKKSGLGKEISNAFRNRNEIKFA